jgi:hypothetical protein
MEFEQVHACGYAEHRKYSITQKQKNPRFVSYDFFHEFYLSLSYKLKETKF